LQGEGEMSGLFSNLTRSHRGPGFKAIAARKAQGTKTVSDFAEALSNHGSVTKAAREIGVSVRHGYILLDRICRELGEQAQ
jgi:molybdenum-dependent DNA-binding transcriptional regulator ModE